MHSQMQMLPGMDTARDALRTFGERLRWAREQHFESAAEAARALDIPEPTYQSHENETRSGKRRAVLYARRFGVSLDWLLTGRGKPKSSIVEAPESITGIQVKGVVQAGVWREIDELPADYGIIPVVEDPRYKNQEQFALKVLGSSMNQVVQDGDYVVCVKFDGDIRGGDLVVVERRKPGMLEATIKRIHVLSRSHVELWPESTDPRHQKPLILEREKTGAEEEIAIVARVIGRYSRL